MFLYLGFRPLVGTGHFLLDRSLERSPSDSKRSLPAPRGVPHPGAYCQWLGWWATRECAPCSLPPAYALGPHAYHEPKTPPRNAQPTRWLLDSTPDTARAHQGLSLLRHHPTFPPASLHGELSVKTQVCTSRSALPRSLRGAPAALSLLVLARRRASLWPQRTPPSAVRVPG